MSAFWRHSRGTSLYWGSIAPVSNSSEDELYLLYINDKAGLSAISSQVCLEYASDDNTNSSVGRNDGHPDDMEQGLQVGALERSMRLIKIGYYPSSRLRALKLQQASGGKEAGLKSLCQILANTIEDFTAYPSLSWISHIRIRNARQSIVILTTKGLVYKYGQESSRIFTELVTVDLTLQPNSANYNYCMLTPVEHQRAILAIGHKDMREASKFSRWVSIVTICYRSLKVLSTWQHAISENPEDFVMSLKPLHQRTVRRSSSLVLLGLCRSWKHFELLAMVEGRVQTALNRSVYVYGSYLYGFEWDAVQERVLIPAPDRTYSVKILFT